MRPWKLVAFSATLALTIFAGAQQNSQEPKPAKPQAKPNVVFILVDNVGWGDWGVYGGQVPTPRIDGLAAQGIRFTNYSIESQCTPTRSAILTGRMPVRTGNERVPLPGEGKMGLAPWEYSMGKLFFDAGYNTAYYGKWHVGNTPGREPNDQGFDEWWGILNSSDEAAYSRYPLWRELGLQMPQIWEGRKGSPSKPVAPFDMQAKIFMDENITKHGVEYIKNQASKSKPFFLYLALTQVHPPMVVHPDFAGKSTARGGIYADAIGEMDFRVGQILDAIKVAGVENETIVVLSSDNATGGVMGSGGGSNGPWRGNFFTPPFEGSYRVPAMIRWPGKIPAGVVSNDMLAAEDWMPTLAGLAGEAQRVPTDRPIDGVDASTFMLGKNTKSGRDTFMFFGPDGELMSVKWHTVKVVFRYANGIDKPIVKPYLPMLFDLSSDPQESLNLWEYNMETGWMFAPALKAAAEYQKSVAKYPNIKPGQDFDGYKQ